MKSLQITKRIENRLLIGKSENSLAVWTRDWEQVLQNVRHTLAELGCQVAED